MNVVSTKGQRSPQENADSIPEAIYFTYIPSPLGQLLLTMEQDWLTNICIHQQKRVVDIDPTWISNPRPFRLVTQQLEQYFLGNRHRFDVPFRLNGTEFQNAVWDELLKIPYGTTITYGELAKRINKPQAVRAVGLANGQNRLPIIIPCHRVIGANGKLTGFGGGIENKALLLRTEQGEVIV